LFTPHRADYADDGTIKELISWQHPLIAGTDDLEYTKEENLAMLGLPRKECWLSTALSSNFAHISI